MLRTWERINGIKNIRNIPKKNINCLNINDIEETDQVILSDYFNKFSTTIAEKIESKIMPTNKNYTDYLTNPSKKTYFLRPNWRYNENMKCLGLGVTQKSLGPNGIPTKLLKQFPKSISIPLSYLINFFKNGVFPNALKLVSVIPVF